MAADRRPGLIEDQLRQYADALEGRFGPAVDESVPHAGSPVPSAEAEGLRADGGATLRRIHPVSNGERPGPPPPPLSTDRAPGLPAPGREEPSRPSWRLVLIAAVVLIVAATAAVLVRRYDAAPATRTVTTDPVPGHGPASSVNPVLPALSQPPLFTGARLAEARDRCVADLGANVSKARPAQPSTVQAAAAAEISGRGTVRVLLAADNGVFTCELPGPGADPHSGGTPYQMSTPGVPFAAGRIATNSPQAPSFSSIRIGASGPAGPDVVAVTGELPDGSRYPGIVLGGSYAVDLPLTAVAGRRTDPAVDLVLIWQLTDGTQRASRADLLGQGSGLIDPGWLCARDPACEAQRWADARAEDARRRQAGAVTTQSAALADGVITAPEFDAAMAAFMRCADKNGHGEMLVGPRFRTWVDLPGDDGFGGSVFSLGPLTWRPVMVGSPSAAEAAVAPCARQHVDLIAYLGEVAEAQLRLADNEALARRYGGN